MNITGVSFPFRLNSRGGLTLSTTTSDDSTHLEEGMLQILQTFKYDRPMESHFYSSLDSFMFSSMNSDDISLLKYFIRDALKLETRVYVPIEGISVKPFYTDDSTVRVDIKYTRYDNNQEYEVSYNLPAGGN